MNSLIGNRKYVIFGLLTLLLVFWASLIGYADVTPVKDRTPQVRDAIVAAVPGVNNANDVTEAHLAAITTLRIYGITSLRNGDFDGLTAMTNLDLFWNALSILPSDIFDDLTALTELNLGLNDLTSLPSNIFDDLTALTKLNLSSNDLTSLPLGIFDNLTALTDLDLGSNDLTSLPLGIFDNLTALTDLDLGSNDLTSLPLGIFDNLTALTDLDLGSNDLTSLPSDIFDDLTALTSLDLSHNYSHNYSHNFNRLTSLLPSDIFDDLTALTSLDLSHNYLTSLPSGIFDDLTALTRLDLRSNNLSSLPSGIFDDLGALYNLDLSNNKLTNIPSGIFDDLTALTRLDLSYNHISSLPSGIFDDLGALYNLNLSNNKLTNIPSGIFEGLSSLVFVYLSGNTVDPIPLTVKLQKVADGQFKAVVPTGAPFDMDLPLYVVNGSISGGATSVKIPTGSVESDTLTVTRTPGTTAAVVVDLERTVAHQGSGYSFYKSSYHLEMFSALAGAPTPVPDRTPQVIEAIVGEVPGIDYAHHNTDLRYMIDGKFVDKKYNAAHYVSEAHLAAITSLNATGGSGTTFDSLFGGLAGNWFRQLGDITALKTGDFDGMTNLERLYLSGNKLSSLPSRIFDKLTNLKTLDLSSNVLSSLPSGVFDKLTNLTGLSLFNNDFSSLSTGIFDKLTNLKQLNLSSNQLSSLPAGLFDKLTNLTYLNLLDNPLRSLPSNYFDKLSKLETLFLPPTITPPTLPAVNTITSVADRTSQVRDAIVAAAGVNSAADVTAGHLAAITELAIGRGEINTDGSITLNDDSLTSLKSGDFDNLTNLEYLAFVGSFSSLPNGIFDNLVNLNALGIVSTQMSSLSDGIFNNLVNLNTLSITCTQLSSLPDGIFDNLANVSTLSIVYTQLSSLPDNIFDSFTNLPFLQLSNNQLSSLPEGILDKATMILDLSNNQLSSLPDGIFKGIFSAAPNLTGMSVLGIPLGQVPEDRLDELGEYTTISLTGNLVDPLPLTISLKKVGNGQFKAVAPSGAPFKLVLPITVANGTVTGGATSVTIPVGGVESETFTVTRTAGTTLDVSVDIGTLPSIWSNHSGYTLVKSSDLPLVFTEFGGGILSVSARTPEVRDAIVRAVPGVNAAADVTASHLASITELGVAFRDSVSLKAADFEGLTGLTALSLATKVTSIPAGLFRDLSNLTILEWLASNLSTLPTDAFDGLTNLNVLVIEAKSLSALSTGFFKGLTNLTDVVIAGAIDPLPLNVSLEKVADGQFKAVAPQGAPFNIVLPITVTNGSISGGSTTVTIPAGSLESGTSIVTRTAGTTAAVTADIGTLPDLPSDHRGYALIKSSNLPLSVINAVNVPIFTEGSSTTRTVAENTEANTNIGAAVAATDADTGDTLTYTLGGIDAASFGIVSTTGQLQTKASLDYETKSSYTVTVEVSDGNDGLDSIDVTINVTDIDEIEPPLSDRTAQVRDAIVSAVPGVSDAADVTAAHLAAITTLNLSGKSITSLKPGDFSGLTSLRWLDLGGNSISDVSALKNLTSLGTLSLGGNSISDISTLENLTSLVFLSLRYNSISDISALENLTSLTNLDLQNNSISNISALENLTLLRNLNLSANYSISDISVLKNLTSVVYLNLEQNSISDVSALAGLISLVDLDLKNNLIADYGPLRRLKAANPDVDIDIDLNNNPPVFSEGSSTTRSIAENTPSWRNIGAPVSATDADNDTLDYFLRGTDAASFSVGLRSGQLQNRVSFDYDTKSSYSVTIVVSDGNGGGNSIDVTINVTEVIEIDPPLSTRTQAVRDAIVAAVPGVNSTAEVTGEQLAAITALYLSNQNITSLKAGDFDGLTTLSTLWLSNNSISDLSPLEDLTALTYLELYNNSISDLSPLEDLTTLTSLHLSGNSISDISLFEDLTSLTSLSLGYNSISDITKLKDLTSLTSLSLGANSISDISVLEELTSLTRLDLFDNSISDISILEDLTSLTHLHLSGNSISDISALEKLTSLTNLRLGRNAISDISALEDLTSLTILELFDNSISDISALEDLTSLTDVWLRDNPISDYGPLRRLKAANPGVTIDINLSPVFSDGASTTRSIAENTASGQNIGTAISATDVNTGDTLTYSLGGTDASSFSIVSTSGQLQTRAALDYETKTAYTVTISVSDGHGGSDSIIVNITVTDIEEIDPPLSDRTAQVRDAIVSAVPGVNDAADVTVAQLATITFLNLNGKSITSLKAGDFSGLTSLNRLFLRGNSISDISALKNLTSLITLDLQNNSISNISALENLTSLRSLNLSANYSISDISVLKNLTSMLYIDLEQNSISDVSALEGLISLEDLDLRNNLISDYGPLRRLKAANPDVDIDVDLNNNPPVFSEGASTTRSIAEDTLSWRNIGAPVSATDADNDTLNYFLRGTDSASFHVGLRTGQLQNRGSFDYDTKSSYSVTIVVSDGNGGGDSIDVTINVTEVIAIDPPLSARTSAVRNAIIAAIPRVNSAADVTEAHLAAITSLDLNRKGIKSFKIGDFNGLTSLTSLNLSFNDITDISTLEDLTSLTSLNLWFNELSDISALEKLTALTSLNLSENYISDISALEDLSSLTSLDLRNNSISDISALEDLSSLTSLSLSNNSISDISTLDALTSLTRLTLDGNSIIDISALEDLTSLTDLDLSRNSIGDISALEDLTSLDIHRSAEQFHKRCFCT